LKFSASLAGSFLASEATLPLLISLTEIDLQLNPTLSPGIASYKASWCISTDLTSDSTFEGANQMDIFGFKTPVSTLPTGTVPIPPILYTSYNGNLNGLSTGVFGGVTASKASIRVGPLNQERLADFSIMLSPYHPDIGMKGMLSGLYPTFFKNP
jgi:hypothetical protein